MLFLSLFKKEFILTTADERKIVQAIAQAENQTSGEIRVHVDNDSPEDVFAKAAEKFVELQMHKTKDRNGVLFFIAPKNKKFAIVADEGINKVVPPDFWDQIKNEISKQFKKGRFVKGIILGLEQSGSYLKKYFPLASDDTNELSNEISR